MANSCLEDHIEYFGMVVLYGGQWALELIMPTSTSIDESF